MEAAPGAAVADQPASPPTATPTTYQIPDGVHVELDQDGWQWTDVRGAMTLTGMSRRTIQVWLRDGKVDVRRTPSNRPRIRVASLWRTE